MGMKMDFSVSAVLKYQKNENSKKVKIVKEVIVNKLKGEKERCLITFRLWRCFTNIYFLTWLVFRGKLLSRMGSRMFFVCFIATFSVFYYNLVLVV